MRRKTIILSSAMLCILTIIVSACNLSSLPAAPDYNATETAFSFLFTQIAATPTIITPILIVSPTPSPTVTPNPFFTFTPTPPTFIPPTIGPRPPYYVLQPGEYPYCIARRFNVHPKDLLNANHLSSGMTYEPGLLLTIPQTGRPFPPPRALHSHPATFSVPEYQMTVYKVACYFGDVDPVTIMQYNGLTSPILTYGMTLHIP